MEMFESLFESRMLEFDLPQVSPHVLTSFC